MSRSVFQFAVVTALVSFTLTSLYSQTGRVGVGTGDEIRAKLEVAGGLLVTSNSFIVGAQSQDSLPEYTMGVQSSAADSSGILYDSGGPEGGYGNNESLTFAINPNGADFIRLTFEEFDTEEPDDSLQVIGYDATNTEEVLYTLSGMQASTVDLYSFVRLEFKTNGSVTKPGFKIRWDKGYTVQEEQPEIDGGRLQWIPDQYALRSGYVASNSDAWNYENIGRHSTAFGFNTKASAYVSVATGFGTSATGDYSTAMGAQTLADGVFAVAWGDSAMATGNWSTAYGFETKASGAAATAWGNNAVASGVRSTAWGFETKSPGQDATAWGFRNVASGAFSTSWGLNDTASANLSTAWGSNTDASGFRSTTWGVSTLANQTDATAWGNNSQATGSQATAWGVFSKALSSRSTAWGYGSQAASVSATAWGDTTIASGLTSTAWGKSSVASGTRSTAWGDQSEATNDNATAWGDSTVASGEGATSWGDRNEARGSNSTAWGVENLSFGVTTTTWGRMNQATFNSATAWGEENHAAGSVSTSWGVGNTSSDFVATSWGFLNTASGPYSTAWGRETIATGDRATAWGWLTSASGDYATASGVGSNASGVSSTAMGAYAQSAAFASLAIGRYNIGSGDGLTWVDTDPLFEVGNGSSDVDRGNAMTVLKNGNVGIDTNTPDVKLHITGGTDAQLSTGGYLVTGSLASSNLVIDDNEIHARFNNGSSTLFLNNDGGTVQTGSDIQSGGDLITALGDGVVNAGGGAMTSTINYFGDSYVAPTNVNGDEDLYIADDLQVGSNAYKPGGGAWDAASDQRLKSDIEPYGDGLEQVLSINPVTYKYNSRFEALNTGETYVGVLAQDILEVAPYMVALTPFGQITSEDENGNEVILEQGTEYYTYDASALPYMLVNAVKEQQQTITDQQQVIEEQQSQLDDQSALIQQLLERVEALEGN